MAMALGARMVLAVAVAVAVMVLTAGVSVSGAPLAVSAEARITARLQVIAGDNATCPWQVSLLDAGGYDGGRQLCAQELGFSFGGSPTIAEVPTPTLYTNSTTELPLLVGIQSSTSTPSEPISSLKAGATEERGAAASPPEGYERVGLHGFYKLHLEQRTWHGARDKCELEGAHLLVLDSSAEAHALRRFLDNKIARTNDDELHAGFRLDLRTVQGERLTYESWSKGARLPAFCGKIDEDVWMLYGACSGFLPFICEYEPQGSKGVTETPSPTPTPVPAPTAPCANTKREILTGRGYAPLDGWNGTYVKRLEPISRSSWQKAKEACEKDGAQLVIMESEEKADALLAFVQASGINYFVLGVKTGDPVTVLGEPLQNKSYQRWAEKNQQESCFCSSRKLRYFTCHCTENSDYNTIAIICQVNVN